MAESNLKPLLDLPGDCVGGERLFKTGLRFIVRGKTDKTSLDGLETASYLCRSIEDIASQLDQ